MRPTIDLAAVDAAVSADGLAVTGAFYATPDDRVPERCATLCLIGPADGRMWTAFDMSAEAADGAAHPLDRWSRRVIEQAANRLGAEALFPFGGPPWLPFLAWAARAEGAMPSPIGMSVTAARGLHASWRGALAFATRLDGVGAPAAAPCESCARPCVTACPVDAFATGRYDVDGCRAFLATPDGADCRAQGCKARRVCPASAALPQAQRAFHLAAFLGASRPG
ncbi:MAG: ferredoxin [Pseudomonadota bacterium]